MSSTSKESLVHLLRDYYVQNDQEVHPTIRIDDWDEVAALASKQGASGICLELIERLPKESLPNRKVILSLIGITNQIESHYRQQVKAIQEISCLFRENAITPVLLKGYGLSLNYPIPSHRPSGDIDLFLSDGKRADELIKGLGVEVKQNEEKHSTFRFRGIHVENHATVICEIEHKSLSRVEQFLEGELKEHSSFDDVTGCYLPSAMFNAVYLPLHLGSHFVYGGANLRQILDYALMVKKSCGKIDWNRVKHLAEGGGYFGFLCCLNGICIDHLGLSSELFPNWERNLEVETIVLDDILTSGNNAPTSVFGKIKKFHDNRWKYNLVYGNESHVIGFCKRIRSWLIWKWGIGRKSVWD